MVDLERRSLVKRLGGAGSMILLNPMGIGSFLPGISSSTFSQQEIRDNVGISKTNSRGVVRFWDEGVTLTVEVADSSDNRLEGMLVQYLDGSDFEAFIVEDPQGRYSPSFEVYGHRPAPRITMNVSVPDRHIPITMRASPSIEEISNSSERGQALEGLVEYAKNESLYIGRRTPEQLDAENEIYSLIVGSLGENLTRVSDVAGRIAELSGSISNWQEPEFYDVYEVIPESPVTTTIRVLVPVEDESETVSGNGRTLEMRLEEGMTYAVNLTDGTLTRHTGNYAFTDMNPEFTGMEDLVISIRSSGRANFGFPNVEALRKLSEKKLGHYDVKRGHFIMKKFELPSSFLGAEISTSLFMLEPRHVGTGHVDIITPTNEGGGIGIFEVLKYHWDKNILTLKVDYLERDDLPDIGGELESSLYVFLRDKYEDRIER